MADEIKDLEPTEENTAPDADVTEATGTYNPAFPNEGEAPDFTTPAAEGSPVDLAAPSAPAGVDAGVDSTEAESVEGDGYVETAEEDPAEVEPVDPTAGGVDAPVEDAATADQGTLNLPSTGETSSGEAASPSAALPAEPEAVAPAGEPADMAGAPSAGKPIDASVPTVPTDVGYPVPKEDESEPPVHPITLQPLVNDGLGEDQGKVGELPSASKPDQGSSASEDGEGTNVAELEEAVGKLGGRFDQLSEKLDGLAAQLKRVLHKL